MATTSSSSRAEPHRLESHVRTLAEDLVPRDSSHPDGMAQAANFVRDELSNWCDQVDVQPYDAGGMEVRNVRARFGPAEGERIVIGAHYDVAGPYPGADDNASGVAGLLELARLLSAEDPHMPVELVSYPLEEPPFFGTRQMGSYVHAQSLREQGVEVRAMIALEMIGYFTDEPKSQRFPLFVLRPFYPSEGNFIAVVGKWGQGDLVKTIREGMRDNTPLPVESISAPPILPGVNLSDHRSYWKAGFEAVMITDTAFFRNPNYHMRSDTPDTLDYNRMAQVVDGLIGALRKLGGIP